MEAWVRHSLQIESPHEITMGSLPPPRGVKFSLQDGQAASIFYIAKSIIKCG